MTCRIEASHLLSGGETNKIPRDMVSRKGQHFGARYCGRHLTVNTYAAFLCLLVTSFAQAADVGYECPRTTSQHKKIEGFPDANWHGTSALAVALPTDGYWIARENNDYRGKLFWWANGYSARIDPTPELKVSGYRLDGASKPASVSRASNVLGRSQGMDGMVHLIAFPDEGCWLINGAYEGHTVEFVMEVRGTDYELNSLLRRRGFWDIELSGAPLNDGELRQSP